MGSFVCVAVERHRKLAAGLLVGLAVLTLLLSARAGMAPTPDAYVYYGLSRSLLETGRYESYHLSGAPLHVKYPPGYPALLALVALIAPGRVLFLNGVGAAALLIGTGLLIRHLTSRNWPGGALTLAAVLILANRHMAIYAWSTMSDVPYLGVVGLCLWLFPRAGRPAVRFLLAGLLVGLLGTGVRTAGFALVAALGLFLLFRRRWRAAFAYGVGAVAGIAPWITWVLLHRTKTPDHYLRALTYESAGQFLASAGDRAAAFTAGLGRLAVPHLDRLLPLPWIPLVLGTALAILLVWYLVSRRPRGTLLLTLVLLAHALLILTARFFPHLRYLFPVYLVIVFLLGRAVFTEGFLGRFGRIAGGALIAWTLLVSFVAAARSFGSEIELWSEPPVSPRRIEASGASEVEKESLMSLIRVRDLLPPEVEVVHIAGRMRGASYAAVLLPVPVGWERPATVEAAAKILSREGGEGRVLVLAPRRRGLTGPFAELARAGRLVAAPELDTRRYLAFMFR